MAWNIQTAKIYMRTCFKWPVRTTGEPPNSKPGGVCKPSWCPTSMGAQSAPLCDPLAFLSKGEPAQKRTKNEPKPPKPARIGCCHLTGPPALRENTNSAKRTRTARATPPVNQLCCHRTLTASRLPGAGPSTEWCPEVISQNLAREGTRMASERASGRPAGQAGVEGLAYRASRAQPNAEDNPDAQPTAEHISND